MADNSALKKILKDLLREKGEMPIDEFMELALTHPEHGYYIHKPAIGRKGDFITSPEISQLFGEIIGAWCIHVWMEMGRPKKFRLIELGPGKGTLMADIIRASKIMPDFHDNLQVSLVDCNRILKDMQVENLKEYLPIITWYDTIDDIPNDMPFILIANEFLDALPIKQFINDNDIWKERVVTIDSRGILKFTKSKLDSKPTIALPATDKAPKQGLYEYNPMAFEISQKIAQKVSKCKGYALFIDYGYDAPPQPYKDTLQSVFKHRQTHVLKNIGEQDITSHVNFGLVRQAGEKSECNTTPVCLQSSFLMSLGIEVRAAMLSKNAKNDRQRLNIRAGLQRLINPDQMGKLFKVMAFYPSDATEPEGFLSNDDITSEK